MKVADLCEILQQIAPTRFAEPWDNVGLLIGDAAAHVSRILLTIDLTAPVLTEAKRTRCQLVIAYHPPIFQPLKRITAPAVIHDAIQSGLAVYSPHTALDIADGGTNDMLADTLGLLDRKPLRSVDIQSSQCKLVTFVPAQNIEAVSSALFAAGAGKIGDYSSCGFTNPGTGTFFGSTETNPAIGRRGRLERVEELRLETLVPIAHVADVIRALRQAHPYEEPAFDLLQLASTDCDRGMGRIGAIKPTNRTTLLKQIKRRLGVKHLLIAGPTTGNVKLAAVCAGSCGKLLHDAIAQNAEFFLTGEVRHHDALAAAAAGMTVVCALHSNSERPVLARLKSRLQKSAPNLKVDISRADRDPLSIA